MNISIRVAAAVLGVTACFTTATAQAAGNYPMGTNIALYVGPDNFMVEMETMGPVVTVKPGQVLAHRETWVLTTAKAAPTSEKLRGLFV